MLLVLPVLFCSTCVRTELFGREAFFFIFSGVWAGAIGTAHCTVGELIYRCSSLVFRDACERGMGRAGFVLQYAFWC